MSEECFAIAGSRQQAEWRKSHQPDHCHRNRAMGHAIDRTEAYGGFLVLHELWGSPVPGAASNMSFLILEYFWEGTNEEQS